MCSVMRLDHVEKAKSICVVWWYRPDKFSRWITALSVPVNLDFFQLVNLGCMWSYNFYGCKRMRAPLILQL